MDFLVFYHTFGYQLIENVLYELSTEPQFV